VAPISRAGRFRHTFDVDGRARLSGDFLRSGHLRGRLDYEDRVCSAGASFTARARVRRAGMPGTVFALFDGGRVEEGGPATSAGIFATGIDERRDGSLLVADITAIDSRARPFIRAIDRDGRVRTLLRPSDGIDLPADLAVTPDGGYLFTEPGRNCVRRVDPAGALSTAAGRCEQGEGGFSGDGGPATAARLSGPQQLSVMPDGGFFVTDGGGSGSIFATNRRIRQVAPDGTISTVAGTGMEGSGGDGGPAALASFADIYDVEAESDGGFLISDAGAARVRRVRPDGTISTVAGTGFRGFSGDGGAARAARLEPHSLLALGGGAFLVSELAVGRLRRVSADGTIDTVAGAGEVATGVPAGRAAPVAGALTRLGDGSLVSGGRLIVSAASRRLLMGLPARAITYRRAVARRDGIPIAVTRRSRVVVELRRSAQTLMRAARTVAKGESRLRFPARLRPRRGRGYNLLVTVTAGRAIATARLKLHFP
jgi:hypothetical protein